jgi:hypothetical protein
LTNILIPRSSTRTTTTTSSNKRPQPLDLARDDAAAAAGAHVAEDSSDGIHVGAHGDNGVGRAQQLAVGPTHLGAQAGRHVSHLPAHRIVHGAQLW